MKKWTQAEFDALERDEYGFMRLGTGDFTDVDFRGTDKMVFGDCCKLGVGCELGGGGTLGAVSYTHLF